MKKLFIKTESDESKQGFLIRYPSKYIKFKRRNLNSSYSSRVTFNYCVIDFKDYFNLLRNSKVEIPKDYNVETLHLIELSNNDKEAMNLIKIAANKEELDMSFARSLLRAYKNIFDSLARNQKWTEGDYFIAPLKGGSVVLRLFPLDEKKVFKIDCKRLPLSKEEGYFSFGMHVNKQPSVSNLNFATKFNNKKLTILEMCVASGITTIGILTDLHVKNIMPKEIIVVSVSISWQGYLKVMEVAEKFNFKVKFITAYLTGNLADFYYLTIDPLMYNNGQYIIRNPSDTLKVLGKNYYKKL